MTKRRFVAGTLLAGGLLLAAPATAADVEHLKLTASDGNALDLFGTAVAVSGDTAVVGAPHEAAGLTPLQGAVYVFTRTGATWTQQAKLTAADGAPGDRFGQTVAIEGDTVVVGAFWHDIGGMVDQGAAYVFTRTGATWTQQAKLTASDGAVSDNFGFSVAVSGDTAVVGAYFANVSANIHQGAAYVFTRSGSTWTQQAKLTAKDGSPGDVFGERVAVSGDTALVGASGDDVGDNEDQGSVYVFGRTGASWSQQAQLTASDGLAGDSFGFWVAVDGDTAVVGAFLDDIGANSDQGSAYVFSRTGRRWTQQAQLTASDGAAKDLFGRSVAVSRGTVIVGAQFDDHDDTRSGDNDGSAYVFSRVGGTWTAGPKLTAADAPGGLFGVCVAISGDTMIVGANFADVGANRHQGAAYVAGGSAPRPGR